MIRRLWLSLAMMALGAALLVTAQLAGATSDRKGGIFRVGTTGASVQVDPQLAYITTAWWLEYATAAKLYNYSPKGTLVPEVASRFAVSNEGKRYTFFIRKGFRFSDGSPVTAASFKYAINRVANHDLASPGAAFIIDANGTDIVGAKAVNDGQGTDVRGVRFRGNRLIIDLTRPDGSFLSKLTMPFFQATSRKLPLTQEVVNVSSIRDMPSAGPYAYSRNEVNVLTSIRRNPYWKPGPGRMGPRNLNGLDIQWNLNEETAYNQVLANELDEGPLPAAHVEEVAARFGVNRSRFWAKPVNCIGWVLFNNRGHLLKGNRPMRKAINWALDRTDYVAQAGPYAGSPWTHLLPPGFPGSISAKKLQPYAPRSDIAKARTLAAGHFRDGKITVYFRSSGMTNNAQAELVRRDLIRLGFDAGNITMKGFSGGDIYDAWGTRGNDADIGVSMGSCADDPDPYIFFAPLRPFLVSTKYEAKIAAAAKLRGNARLRAFGKLDLELTRNFAPLAAMRTYNNRYFFSDRVDPRSLKYHGIYQDWSIPALALK
jgi:ABC-type oligopeptide transport system substrate-binding subunit